MANNPESAKLMERVLLRPFWTMPELHQYCTFTANALRNKQEDLHDGSITDRTNEQ